MKHKTFVNIIKKLWVKIRLTVIILLSITIGVSWTIAIPKYQEMRKDANWTYQEVQKLQEQRIENKSNDVSVSGTVYPPLTEAHEQLEAVAADQITATSPSEVIATTYNAEVGQTDSDPFIMASGKKVYEGAVASNCHPLGTKLEIEGKEFTVEDRMNKRYTPLCGTEKERVDIFKWDRKDNFSKRLAYKIL